MQTPAQPEVQFRPRRPRPQVVTLTEAAAERVREIMAKADKPYAGLRVGVKNGGCAGQEYILEYAAEAGPHDEVVEDKGVKVLIEPQAVLFLLGTVVDYETTKLASKFVFRNPNETDACGCGESVTIVPAKAG
jgi:iron-sulfur cluster assembly protein